MYKVFTMDLITKARSLISPKIAFTILAFAFPLYPPLVPVLVVLSILSCIIYRKELSFSLNPRASLLLIGFYLFHVTGLFISEDKGLASFDLEVKLSLLVFPLLSFVSVQVVKDSFDGILESFIQGCFAALLFCYAQSFIKYSATGELNSFSYNELTPFLHTSYIAMYLNFSLLAVFYLIRKNYFTLNIWLILYAVFAVFSIVLLASKAGVVTLGITLIFGLIFLIRHGRIRLAILTATGLIVVSAVMIKNVPTLANRLGSIAGMNKTDSLDVTQDRKQTWKSSVEIISSNFWFGTGTGDVVSDLVNIYKARGYEKPLQRRLNSHNQFLQTFAGLGIIGFLLLIASVLIPFYISIKKRFWLFTLFLILVIVNMLFESMLQTQAGVVFFAFFISLMLAMTEKPKTGMDTLSSARRE